MKGQGAIELSKLRISDLTMDGYIVLGESNESNDAGTIGILHERVPNSQKMSRLFFAAVCSLCASNRRRQRVL